MVKKIKTRKQKFGVPRSLHEKYPHVKFVVDASEPIDVSVCQHDVDHSNKKDPTSCAMAVAVKRVFKVDACVIGLNSSYIIRGDRAIRYETPESVQREIVSFDRHHDFQPGDYHLRPKSPTMRLGNKPAKWRDKKGGKYKSARRVHHTKNVRVMPTGGA